MNTPRLEAGVRVTAALVFAASAVLTVAWCASMDQMPGMQMPGGWTMSMAWMRMPGQGWLEAAGVFVAMWALMMLAMMMPVLVPELKGLRAGAALAFSAGYFVMWAVAGLAIYPLGVAFAELAMRHEIVSAATPWLAAVTVLLAGLLQFSRGKSRLLACCHRSDRSGEMAGSGRALRAGFQLGLRCVCCCANLTAVLLVVGVMDLRAMAAITVAICAERLAPSQGVLARLIGVALLLYGSMLFVDAWLEVV